MRKPLFSLCWAFRIFLVYLRLLGLESKVSPTILLRCYALKTLSFIAEIPTVVQGLAFALTERSVSQIDSQSDEIKVVVKLRIRNICINC